MKEFELTLKLRNNRLLQRREEMGLSALKVAGLIGLSYGIYLGYELLRVNPLLSRPRSNYPGRWKPTALKISKFYGVKPGELWPGAIRQVKKAKIQRRIDAEQMACLLGASTLLTPEDLLLEKEKVTALTTAVHNRLTGRECQVVVEHFGLEDGEEKSYNAVGAKIPNRMSEGTVTRERVRQIEAKALRKLRHSSSKLRSLFVLTD